MDKNIDVRWIGLVVVLLPYEIGLLFMLFGAITLVQVLFFGTLFYALVFALVVVFKAPLATILGMLIGSNL